MPFLIYADCSANLPPKLAKEHDIKIIPCTYSVDGVPVSYDGDLDSFDFKSYYDSLRAGAVVTTSLYNQHTFINAFAPELGKGYDVVYISMSSGISGTYHSSTLAASHLMSEFPGRVVRTVDSKGAGLGIGLLCCLCDDDRRGGRTADEAADRLDGDVERLCQYFTVDDLMFLRRTGRISTPLAAIGTLLGIKPMLWGNETGHIVECGKYRGRKRVIDAIIEKYKTKAQHVEYQRVFISHGDCADDAEEIRRRILEFSNPKELYVCPHEPLTGSHVGPGMLSLFFLGDSR